eukprot:scaffold12183_cov68-Phaeocystis_antarctica.AAC.15
MTYYKYTRLARVSSRAGLVISAHLRREEGGRACRAAHVVARPALAADGRDAKVGELGALARRVPQDILRLEVAVAHA